MSIAINCTINKTAHPVWHLDETYIKVKGEWCYLYR
ncbi:DDE-type integrase/transposase/recombinase, partial [Bacillus sp. HC-TM]